MRVLGISAFYHDSAAALIEDGQLVGAAQEERFTRKKHDSGFPAERRAVLPRRGRHQAGRRRLRRLLRQAVPEVRAPARDLPRLRAARLQLVPHGHAAVAEGEAVPEDAAARRDEALAARLRLAEAPAVRRASPEPRRLGLLPLALRGGRRAVHGRRRRMGDHVARLGPGQQARDAEGDPLPALARAALFGLHLLHGLQGQFRRVQGHGPGALRRAQVQGHDPRATSSTSRRTAPSGSTRPISTIAPGCA